MLSLEDRAILDFERAWACRAGPKDRVIETELGLTARAYYDRLRMLVVGGVAMTYDPLTAKRVLRMIDDPMKSELAV